MRTQGNCGRGNRNYNGEADVLNGRLAIDHQDIETPEDDDDPETPEVKRCEHGVPLRQILKCYHCRWMFGMERRSQ